MSNRQRQDMTDMPTPEKDGITVYQVLIQGTFSNKIEFNLCAQLGGGYFSSTSSEGRIVHNVRVQRSAVESETGIGIIGKEWLQVTKLLQDAIKTVDDHTVKSSREQTAIECDNPSCIFFSKEVANA